MTNLKATKCSFLEDFDKLHLAARAGDENKATTHSNPVSQIRPQKQGRRHRGGWGYVPPGRRNRGDIPPPPRIDMSYLFNGKEKFWKGKSALLRKQWTKSGEFLILGVGLVGPFPPLKIPWRRSCSEAIIIKIYKYFNHYLNHFLSVVYYLSHFDGFVTFSSAQRHGSYFQ